MVWVVFSTKVKNLVTQEKPKFVLEKRANFVENINHEIQLIISGKSEVRYGAIIKAIAHYLRRSQSANSMAQDTLLYKKEETEALKKYVSRNKLWISKDSIGGYISEGAEQKVYLNDEKYVIKLNDSIFYTSWEDYLNSLLLHNYFFPDTAYELIGFMEDNSVMFAVVRQPFVTATEKTDLEAVKKFMSENGFINTKNNDYRNPELGLILEDLHDENVLTKDGVLYFVDTVFYILPNNKM